MPRRYIFPAVSALATSGQLTAEPANHFNEISPTHVRLRMSLGTTPVFEAYQIRAAMSAQGQSLDPFAGTRVKCGRDVYAKRMCDGLLPIPRSLASSHHQSSSECKKKLWLTRVGTHYEVDCHLSAPLSRPIRLLVQFYHRYDRRSS